MALGAIPMLFGGLRLVELLGGLAVMPARPSFVASPVPVAVHIASAVVYLALGALQFSAGFRRRHPHWHRRSGRVLVPLGLLVAFSALWMNQFYELPDGPNPLLYVFRLVFGTAMAASIVVGFLAVRRRDIRSHRAWMVRAYAIGLGAGTQVFTIGFGEAIFGKTEVTTALCHAAAWVINLAVAERAIRRPSRLVSGWC